MNEEAELIISLSATGLGSEGNMETKKSLSLCWAARHYQARQSYWPCQNGGPYVHSRRLASWRKEDCKAGGVFQEKVAVPTCYSLLGSSVCLASKARQGVQQR